MKIALALVMCTLVVLAAAEIDWSQLDHTNGQPGCRTAEEVATRVWRNNWDPTRFWVCETQGQAAVVELCPQVPGLGSLAFMTSRGECVPWSEWDHEFPLAPPSRP
ncbi:hypothetical protein DMENIID0001_154970 [Sergentomyia squamirostris]